MSADRVLMFSVSFVYLFFLLLRQKEKKTTGFAYSVVTGPKSKGTALKPDLPKGLYHQHLISSTLYPSYTHSHTQTHTLHTHTHGNT